MAADRKTLAAVIGAPAAALLLVMVPQLEDTKRDPYLDIVKVPTVCTGHTGPEVVMGVRKTDAECAALLDGDLVKAATPLVACMPQIKADPYFTAATVSLAFNVGPKAVCDGSVGRAFRAGRPAEGCAAISRFVYAGGRIVPGLVNRRRVERQLCERGL